MPVRRETSTIDFYVDRFAFDFYSYARAPRAYRYY